MIVNKYMKKTIIEFLKKFGKYDIINEAPKKEKVVSMLDLTTERPNHFCTHNPQINSFAKESPETLACVFIFVLSTIRANWAQVYYTFPQIINVLTTSGGIEKIFDTTPEKISLAKAVVFGFKIPAINHIWQNRKSIYNEVKSILNLDEKIDRDYVLYNYIFNNLSGFAAPKAAFAVQLITGSYGCIDSVNQKIYGEFIDVPAIDKNNKKNDAIMQQYVAFLNALKKSTFNLDSAKLWNNWCDIVGHRMNISLKGTKLQVVVKLEKTLASVIDTYVFTDIIRKYKEEFTEVDGETISAQHSQLLSRSTFKESTEIVLNEDYPSDFDWSHLQSLSNLKDIVKYCTSKLGRPRKGSSRIVYLIDDKTVLKVAYNQAGLAQNYNERDGSKQQWFGQLLAEVFRFDEDRLVWLEMERVKPMRNEDQMRKFLGGYTLTDIKEYIDNNMICKNCSDEEKQMYEFFSEDEFILALVEFVMTYQMSLGDALHYRHWGVVMRDGQECAVLMDYGLNAQDFKYHYDSGHVKKQFRHGRLE